MRKTWSRRIEKNILAAYARANDWDRDEGMLWYSKAHAEAVLIAARYDIEPWQAVGVIAALSPGAHWGRNVVEADMLIEAWKDGRDIPQVGTYGRRNVHKALAVLAGGNPLDVLGGSKVRSFFANMLFPLTSDAVTVDRHAKALAYGFASRTARGASDDELSVVRPAEYEYIAWHYRMLAKRLGLVPSQLQAICWLVWRRLRGNLEQEDLPF